MKLRLAILLTTVMGLLSVDLALPRGGLAAAGDVDLEVSVTGNYSTGILGLGPKIEWTITLTNSTADSAINTTATGVTVQDVPSEFSPSTPSRSNIDASTGSYSPGTWTVGSLAPGATATLQFTHQFGLIGSGSGTLSAEVTAQAQHDLDSGPVEDSDVGDQDDEAIWRTGSWTQRTVGDLVWNDLNADGRFTAGEPGIRGVQVIVSSGGARIFAGRTNSTGAWSYTDVASGSAIVTQFILPAGYLFTLSKVGSDTGDSDPDASTGITASRTIGGNDTRIDAGLRTTADLSVNKSVTPPSGSVPLTSEYTVTVTNGGPFAAAGVVLTDNLPAEATLVPGSVVVTQGSTSGSSAITWTLGQVNSGVTSTMTYQLQHSSSGSFDNRAQITAATTYDPDSTAQAASTLCSAQAGQDDCATAWVTVTPATGNLAGTVWRDTDGDGQRDAGEPVEQGATIRRLSAGAVVEATTTTASDGTWAFTNVANGGYIVEVVPPNGARLTLQDVAPDATDNDFPTTGQAGVTVSGGVTTSVDAGLVRADAITGDSLLVPQGVAVSFNLLDNDGIAGRVAGGEVPSGWTWTRAGGPTWGSVTCQTNGSCVYTPLAGYAGTDTFDYSITNPAYGAASAAVSIEVLFVNDPPVARNDRAVTNPGEAVSVEVTANDEDPNNPMSPVDPNRPGDPVAITSAGPVSPPSAGSASCGGQTCTLTTSAGFTGLASFTYTIADTGTSDPRVDDPGVPGGIAAVSPLSATASVQVWVDPGRRPATGFISAVARSTVSGAGSWNPSAAPTATPSCAAGRPRVVVDWASVSKATGYRVERRPQGSTGSWSEVSTVDSGTTSLTDSLVGEGQTFSYRVTPLRRRLSGEASAGVNAVLPAATGPLGC